MVYKEFGDHDAPAVILLHGGGFSWWNYREEARLLQDRFHIILPVLDGHAGSDRHFSSIAQNATAIIAFVHEHLGGSVFCMGGLSLGGQVLLEILAQQGGICRHAVIESAMALPDRFTHALIRTAFGCSYPLMKNRRFAAVQFRSFHISEAYFADYYRDTCAITKDDLIAFMQANTAYAAKESLRDCRANVQIFYGEKETRGIKKSAHLLHKMIPDSTLTALPDTVHGGFSLNRPADYARMIQSLK